jgi:hypothetical protein
MTPRALTVWAAAAAWLLVLTLFGSRERFAEYALFDDVEDSGGGGVEYTPEQLRPARGKRVPPIVTKAGKRAFEVTFKKGQRGGGSSNSSFMLAPSAFFPATEVRFSYKVWFDSSFPWDVNASTPRVGGKLGGFDIGEGPSSGGNFSPEAASYRVTWKDGGGLLAYLYPATRQNFSKESSGAASWAVLDQTPAFQSVSRVSSGIHMFLPKKNEDYKLVVEKETWNSISMYLKLNTPGKYDGVLELTVNGVTERIDEVRYRYSDIKVVGYLLHPFFGGSQRPPTDTKAWFADFEFSK